MGPVDAAEAGVGGLQREQRSLHAAGQLELLGGDQHGLFDFGQQAVVRAGELVVHGLEGDLLTPGIRRSGIRGRRSWSGCPAGFPGPVWPGRGFRWRRCRSWWRRRQFFPHVGKGGCGFRPTASPEAKRNGGNDRGRRHEGAGAGRTGVGGREAGVFAAHGREFNPDRRCGCAPRSGRKAVDEALVARPGGDDGGESGLPGRRGDARMGHEDGHRTQFGRQAAPARWATPSLLVRVRASSRTVAGAGDEGRRIVRGPLRW